MKGYNYVDNMSSKLDQIAKVLNMGISETNLFNILFSGIEDEYDARMFDDDEAIKHLLEDLTINDYVVYTRIDRLYKKGVIDNQKALELHINYKAYKKVNKKLKLLIKKSMDTEYDVEVLKALGECYKSYQQYVDVLKEYNLFNMFDFEEALNTQIDKEIERQYKNVLK